MRKIGFLRLVRPYQWFAKRRSVLVGRPSGFAEALCGATLAWGQVIPECPRWVKTSPQRGVHPREWTGSGCGFDHLPGVFLFERDGAAVVECGVQPLAIVDL